MAFGNYAEVGMTDTADACIVDTTPPTFLGITGLTPKTDGSINAQWNLASDASPPIEYLIYIALGIVNAATLFALPPAAIAPADATDWDIFKLSDRSTYLVKESVYTLGVRAKDAVGNLNTNTAILTAIAIASGNLPDVLQELASLTNILKREVSNAACGPSSVVEQNQIGAAVLQNQITGVVKEVDEIDC